MNNRDVFQGAEQAWGVSVNMGYGHQRTAFPLRDLTFRQEILNANDYQGISNRDKKIWSGIRSSYEAISNFYRVPFLGKPIFNLFDKFQEIISFYPKKDLSRPSFQLKQTARIIRSGLGKDLIEKLKKENEKLGRDLPFVATFFTPAFMAEEFNYPGPIFCVVCDADVSRAWAPLFPKNSKIRYFAPTERVVERLKLYGVNPNNIIFSGYPLPLENIGENSSILKEDLKYRIFNLDPKRKYFTKYRNLIEDNLDGLPDNPSHPLTIMFSIGGAGAQKEIGLNILQNLAGKIASRQIKIILSVGIRKKVKKYFEREINHKFSSLASNDYLEILYKENIFEYFKEFNKKLRETDVLWTKPSELSFYSALGVPIIISPTIGSQEEFNKRWLLKSGFGLAQENPKHTDQWLFDWLDEGYLAEAAMEGFVEGERRGVLKITESLISNEEYIKK